jgi:hypothetical protein
MIRSRRAVGALAVSALFLASCSLLGSSSLSDLAPGECFDAPTTEEFTDLPMVDCSEPHDYEAFAIFDVADGPYPGVAAFDDVALSCIPLFEDYVGMSFESATNLDLAPITPTAGSWDEGDRRMTCVLFDLNGNKLTGSQRDTGA